MKVALIFPEIYDVARFNKKRKEFPPFGVLYLAAILEKRNYDVRIFTVDPDKTGLNLEEFDVVAFSIPSSVTYHIIKSTRENSTILPSALLIAGGVHATIFPEETLKDLGVDVVAFGPGEDTILEIMNEYHSRDFSRINGICYLSGSNIIRTSGRKLKPDLDHLPIIPARHLLPESDLIMSDRLSNTDIRMTHVMFTQGCPYSCNFCASQQRRMQYRSGPHIREELIHLVGTYLIGGFAVVGDNFLVNRGKTREICKSISDLDLRWSTLSRVDMVEYEILEAMYDAGCIEIKYGIESGSEKMLKAMGKNISIAQICNAIKIAHSIGVKVKIFLVHGYPGEDMDTTTETINLLKRLLPMIERISLFRFVPLPGSYVYRNCTKFNLKISNSSDDWNRSHIHHNHYHWWGTEEDFKILSESFKELDEFVAENWD